MAVKQWIRFYADKPGEYKNRKFEFRATNEKHAFGCLYRFEAAGNKIRKAYYDNGSEQREIYTNAMKKRLNL